MTDHVKVRIEFSGDPNTGPTAERLWALPVGDNLYRLDNIPFYALGYAAGDIIRGEFRDEMVQVLGIDTHGPNGTLHIGFVDVETAEVKEILEWIVGTGCIYEGGFNSIAVSVPSTMTVSFSDLSDYLNNTPDDVLPEWEVAKYPPNVG